MSGRYFTSARVASIHSKAIVLLSPHHTFSGSTVLKQYQEGDNKSDVLGSCSLWQLYR